MPDAGDRLARLVAEASGIRLRLPERRRLSVVARRLSGTGEVDSLLQRLGHQRDAPALMQQLMDEVTINESYFLRQSEDLTDIDWYALLAQARRRGGDEVRVWSAACASGEEAYTLAILASEAFGTDRPPVSILATDLSAAALGRAREARYGQRAVRRLPRKLLEAHFTREDDRYRVRRGLRDLVDVQHHNLARGGAPPAGQFDLILCRNVLIYFDPRGIEVAVRVLEQALAPEGTLVFGAADRLCVPSGRPARSTEQEPPPARRPRAVQEQPAVARAPAPAPTLDQALRLADAGRLDDARDMADRLMRKDPMDPTARYVAGTARLAAGDAAGAVAVLRSALYADSRFALAAFKLGRAYDTLGDGRAAARAYARALRTFDPDDERAAALLGDIDVADVAAACEARLRALRTSLPGQAPNDRSGLSRIRPPSR